MKKTLAIIIAVALLLVGCAAVHNNDPAPENEDAVLPTPPPQSYNYTQPNIAHGMYTIFLADTPLGLAKTDGQPTLTAVYAEESTFQPAYFAISVAQMYPYEYYIIQLGDNPDYTLTATVSGETSMVFLTQTVQGLQEQMWRIHDNDDGSFSFILHGADNFRLLFDAGVFRITNVVYEDYENDENDYAPAENDENGYSNGVVTSNFSLVLSATVSPARFVQHISEYGNVILNLGRDIQEQAELHIATLRQWINDLQTAHGNFVSLASHNPAKTITINAHETLATPIVRSGETGVLTFDAEFMVEQLSLLGVRREGGMNDWNFWVLQELARVFLDPTWSFDSDLLARIMIIYVLEQNGAGVSPVSGADVLFDATDIERAYYELGGGNIVENGFTPFSAAYTFVGVKRYVRWSAFRETFAMMWQAPPALAPITRLEQFEQFMDTLSANDRYGRDVRELVGEEAMEVLLEFYGE